MVTRAVLRWLLWSRRRLLVILAAAVLIPIVATHLVAGVSSLATSIATPPPAPTITVVASPPAPAPPVAAAPTDAPSLGPPRLVARTFAQHWVDTAVDPALWHARLQSLSTAEYGLVVLPQVDPSRVPAMSLSGTTRLVRSEERSAEVAVALSGGTTITISLVDVTGAGAWRVNAVRPPSGP